MSAEPRQAPIPSEVLESLDEGLAPKPGYLRVSEVTSHYPFVRAHRLFVGHNEQKRSLAVAWAEGQGARPLALPDGLPALSELLVAETGPLPDGLPPGDLALAIRRLGVDPRGYLGEPEVLNRPIPPRDTFCNGNRAEQQKQRLLFAQAPDVRRRPDGTWALQFFYWNPRGGVELWDVIGAAASLLGATRSEAAPDGSFRWPFR